MNKHLTQEEIEHYIDSEYPFSQNTAESIEAIDQPGFSSMKTDQILKIEEHLVNCDACLEKVTKALDFSLAFYQWMEEGPTGEQKLLLKILKASQNEDHEVKNRVMNWLKDWQGFVDHTVDVFLNTTYKGLSNITKLLTKEANEQKKQWTFRYPVASFAMRGNTDLQFEKKVENTLYGQLGEKDILKIKAQSDKKSVTIHCKKMQQANTSPIVVLVPLEGGDPIIRISRQASQLTRCSSILRI